jgi:glycosyltransferase involved in cell wall biosynthesis
VAETTITVQQPLSVVIPAYNEERTIEDVLRRVLRIPHLLEVIVVDDGSKDKTFEIVDRLQKQFSQLRAVQHEKNGGKTEALKTGFRMTSGEIVIVQDADLEYDPDEIADVIFPILQGRADVVYGSRFLVRRATRVVYFYHYLGNRVLTFLSNMFTNLNMSDVETCYKAFRGDIIRGMVINSTGFGFEIEVTAKIAKLKCPVYEVPISYYGRTYDEGKKIGLRDGLAALWYICKYNVLTSKKSSFRGMAQAAPEAASVQTHV